LSCVKQLPSPHTEKDGVRNVERTCDIMQEHGELTRDVKYRSLSHSDFHGPHTHARSGPRASAEDTRRNFSGIIRGIEIATCLSGAARK
jgi:hypothetical protein